MSRKVNDLTNQRFGRLIALSPTSRRSGTSIVWKCQCDCGEVVYINSNSLVRKQTRSCGCLCRGKIKDLTGQRFGRLVALNPTDERNGSSVIWKCKCDCGQMQVIYVSSSSLMSGNTKSCGCLRKESVRNLMVMKALDNL